MKKSVYNPNLTVKKGMKYFLIVGVGTFLIDAVSGLEASGGYPWLQTSVGAALVSVVTMIQNYWKHS